MNPRSTNNELINQGYNKIVTVLEKLFLKLIPLHKICRDAYHFETLKPSKNTVEKNVCYECMKSH